MLKSKKIKNIFKFTSEQKEVLIGILLGDAHLEQISIITYRLKIEQSLKHKEYIEHLYLIFKDYCNIEPRINKNNNSLIFQTKISISLNFYGNLFYKNKIKIIPKLIEKWLTAKSLAYWYMDDGSIKSKESKGVILNTQCFSEKEVLFLSRILNKKFNLITKLRKKKDGYQIYISGYSYKNLKALIYPYLIDSMKYKFPLEKVI